MDQTLLAYSFESECPAERIVAGLARVERHYGRLVAEPVVRRGDVGSTLGVVTWGRAASACRWPVWSDTGTLAVATTHVPTGWPRVIGGVAAPDAPMALARALLERPSAADELDAPYVLAMLDRVERTLTIRNDPLGAGRLYEMRLEGGCAWSNRVGALPLFAGSRPRADARGWALMAACGWFMGDTTAIAGVTKASPGGIVVAGPDGIRRTRGSLASMVAPRAPASTSEQIDETVDQMTTLASTLGDLSEAPLEVSLSGGRDSRVSAAAALGAGVDARFITTDTRPGEAGIARQVAAAAGQPVEHVVLAPDHLDPNIESSAAMQHLLHDGMIAPECLRVAAHVPRREPPSALMTGYGGAIAKGFFYRRSGWLEQIRSHGDAAALERVERFCRRKHSAARDDAYVEMRCEVERTLGEGHSHGLDGPSLLDWFYLVERLPHKSGFGSRDAVASVFLTPAFIRAAFDMTPEQRTDNALHRELIGRLVPDWADVPFFQPEPAERGMPAVNRPRLWERSAPEVDRMIDEGRGWTEMFEPDRIRAMWRTLTSGGGHAHHEQILERLAWRVSFERHLEVLGDHAAEQPRVVSCDPEGADIFGDRFRTRAGTP